MTAGAGNGPAAARVLEVVGQQLVELRRGPVLVGCSGGADSLTLAAALARVTAGTSRSVTAVIVDHGLQPGSEQQARNTAAYCIGLGLAVRTECAQVQPDGSGPEAAARSARYRVFDAVAQETGAVAVLLAHTRDDQAETVLLGLARGSGLRSLAGMPASRDRFRRPLLALPRSVVRAAGEHWGLEPWHDPHNQDPDYTRVRVRDRVLPVLEAELGPGVAAALARTADLARQDADALESWADREYQERLGADRPELEIAGLAELPAAVSSRVVRRWLIDSGCRRNDLSREHVTMTMGLITRWHGQGPLQLPGRVGVTRRYGRLVTVPPAHADGRDREERQWT